MKTFILAILTPKGFTAPEVTTLSFIYDPEKADDPMAAVRKSIKDFCESGTKSAGDMINYACGTPNWGDIVNEMPDEFFVANGMLPLNLGEVVEASVNHDDIVWLKGAVERGLYNPTTERSGK